MDAFTLADPTLAISNAVTVSDPTSYCRLTDEILTVIRLSDDEELKAAREMLIRVYIIHITLITLIALKNDPLIILC